jgi:hypothetical protein
MFLHKKLSIRFSLPEIADLICTKRPKIIACSNLMKTGCNNADGCPKFHQQQFTCSVQIWAKW